jgi:hypothetical protein
MSSTAPGGPPGAVAALPPLLVVDAANVVGSRPDGWWRDRAGAAARLVAQLHRAARLLQPVRWVVVLEGAAKAGTAETTDSPLAVVHAPGSGDDTIAEQAAGLAAAHPDLPLGVVTADRGLQARLPAGTQLIGPRTLRDVLDAVDGAAGDA